MTTHPRVADVDDEVVDQVEQRVVRPVHVLEHEQERLPLGEMLHEHPHREQQVDRLVGRRVEPEARGSGSGSASPRRPPAVGEELVDGAGELRAGDLDGIVLVDAGDASHHLAGGAVGRLLLVREAPTPQGATSLPLESARRPREPSATCRSRPARGSSRCADGRPRRLGPRRWRGASSSRSRPTSGVCDVGRLPGPRAASTTDHATTGAAFPFASTAGIGSNRKAWRVSRCVSSPTRRPPGAAAFCRRAAVFTTSPVASASPGVGLDGDHGLAGADGSAHLEVESLVGGVELLDPLEDRETGPDGALRVVDPRERRAEHRHDRVADVLLDDPAVALDPFARVLEVELVPIADVLGVGAVGARGRAHDVDEQDRDELAFLLPGAGRRARCRRRGRIARRRGLRSRIDRRSWVRNRRTRCAGGAPTKGWLRPGPVRPPGT